MKRPLQHKPRKDDHRPKKQWLWHSPSVEKECLLIEIKNSGERAVSRATSRHDVRFDGKSEKPPMVEVPALA